MNRLANAGYLALGLALLLLCGALAGLVGRLLLPLIGDLAVIIAIGAAIGFFFLMSWLLDNLEWKKK